MSKFFKSRQFQAFLSVFLPLAAGVIFVAMCQAQVVHKIFGLDTVTLPLPSRILTIIAENLPKFAENSAYTALEAVTGLVAGSVIGYLIAVIAVVFKRFGKGGLTIVSAFNAIPIVALAPVMSNWTKGISQDLNFRSMVAKILVVTVMCVAAMSVNAYKGLTELRPFSEDLMQSYAADKREIFLKLRVPNSVPFIFTALRVSVPLSVISAVVSEYFSEYIIGVGRAIRENFILSQYPTAWAYIFAACVIGLSMYGILMICEHFALKRYRG
jgi:NitT/TauT family transport system permease protein